MSDNQLVELGKLLSKKRTELILSQADVVAMLEKKGVEIIQKVYSNYELGKVKNPKPAVISALSEILEIENLSDLYFRTNNSKNTYGQTKETGEDIRRKKLLGKDDEGLIYVPIGAQAGYALHYTDTIYLNDLDRLYIPGNPFKGDRYRFFEVEGDSMIPTLEEGMQVIGQKIEPESWRNLNEYYIHVIVTESQILIKRLVILDDETLVMISDNEDVYPQVLLKIEDIKELWLVKRTLDWRMAPPKKIELKIKKS